MNTTFVHNNTDMVRNDRQNTSHATPPYCYNRLLSLHLRQLCSHSREKLCSAKEELKNYKTP